MAEEAIKNEEAADEVANPMAEDKIDPNDIIFDEESDGDMPEPETHNYDADNNNENDNLKLRVSSLFMMLFDNCIGQMPYNSTLTNSQGNSIKLVDLMKFVNSCADKDMAVKDMNTILSFIQSCPVKTVTPLMDLVNSDQRVLWTLKK